MMMKTMNQMLKLPWKSQLSLTLTSHFSMNHSAVVLIDLVMLTLIMSFGLLMTVVTELTIAISVNRLAMFVESKLLPALMVKILNVQPKECLVLALTWTMNVTLATIELVKVDLVLRRLKILPLNKEHNS